MQKYNIVINGDKERYEISVATESNLKWANESWGWFGLHKILVKEGGDATDEEWSKILNIAHKICEGLNK